MYQLLLVGMDFQLNVIRKTSRLLNVKALEDKFGATVIDGFRNKYSKRVEYQPKPIDENNTSRLVRNSIKSVRALTNSKQTVNLRKTVENLNSRIELLEKRINDLE